MYEDYFELSEQPFRLSPDPRFFFGSKSHNKAMAYLHYGLRQAEGFIVITGDSGTGKSILIGHLIDQLDRTRISAAHLLTPNLPADALVAHLLSSFGIEAQAEGRAATLDALEEFLFDEMNHGKRVLLIVDEAQSLPHETLEELRILSNMNYEGTPLLQVFLIAQSEFRDTLARKGMEQMRQRVIAAYHLEPMQLEETSAYIKHRLSLVGWADNPQFAEGAFAAIQDATEGTPRRINKLCNRILLHCSVEGLSRVDADVVDSVRTEMDDEEFTSTHRRGEATSAKGDIKPNGALEANGFDAGEQTISTKSSASIDDGPPEDNSKDTNVDESPDDAVERENEDGVSTSQTVLSGTEAETADGIEPYTDETDPDVAASNVKATKAVAADVEDVKRSEPDVEQTASTGVDADAAAADHADRETIETPKAQKVGDTEVMEAVESPPKSTSDAAPLSVLDRLRARKETPVESKPSVQVAKKSDDDALRQEEVAEAEDKSATAADTAVESPADGDVSNELRDVAKAMTLSGPGVSDADFDDLEEDEMDLDAEGSAPSAASIDDVAAAIAKIASDVATSTPPAETDGDNEVADDDVQQMVTAISQRVEAVDIRKAVIKTINEARSDLKEAYTDVERIRRQLAVSDDRRRARREALLAKLNSTEGALQKIRERWRA
ncbi:MAG: AAA family ATPase [Pseudomonadota bacterium]